VLDIPTDSIRFFLKSSTSRFGKLSAPGFLNSKSD
jgi:hypothetical protein